METRLTRQQESSLTKKIDTDLPVRSLDDVFESRLPSLAKIKKEYGNEELKKVLVVKLLEINDLLGVEFTTNQFNYIYNFLIKKAYFINAGDLKLIFEGLLKEKFYGKPTFQHIIEYLEKYIDRRLEYGESLSLSEHGHLKNEERPLDLGELHAEAVRKKL